MSGLPPPFTSAKETKFGSGRLERPITVAEHDSYLAEAKLIRAQLSSLYAGWAGALAASGNLRGVRPPLSDVARRHRRHTVR